MATPLRWPSGPASAAPGKLPQEAGNSPVAPPTVPRRQDSLPFTACLPASATTVYRGPAAEQFRFPDTRRGNDPGSHRRCHVQGVPHRSGVIGRSQLAAPVTAAQAFDVVEPGRIGGNHLGMVGQGDGRNGDVEIVHERSRAAWILPNSTEACGIQSRRRTAARGCACRLSRSARFSPLSSSSKRPSGHWPRSSFTASHHAWTTNLSRLIPRRRAATSIRSRQQRDNTAELEVLKGRTLGFLGGPDKPRARS